MNVVENPHRVQLEDRCTGAVAMVTCVCVYAGTAHTCSALLSEVSQRRTGKTPNSRKLSPAPCGSEAYRVVSVAL